MKPSHYIQVALAIIVACAGAAVPLLVSPMTTIGWLVLIGAEAAAVSKVLSVQTEVSGDKQTTTKVVNAVEQAASDLGAKS